MAEPKFVSRDVDTALQQMQEVGEVKENNLQFHLDAFAFVNAMLQESDRLSKVLDNVIDVDDAEDMSMSQARAARIGCIAYLSMKAEAKRHQHQHVTATHDKAKLDLLRQRLERHENRCPQADKGDKTPYTLIIQLDAWVHSAPAVTAPFEVTEFSWNEPLKKFREVVAQSVHLRHYATQA
ncbi:hypothetical protein OIO90_006642, partial [Microbotryomycetes sp. JL221]